MEKRSNIKAFGARNGFTLVELLVVLLIIGILASVALPQYQKAVEKSHAIEAIANLKKINQAKRLYYLEHGIDELDLTKLDISFTDSFYHYHCIPFYIPEYGGDCYAWRVGRRYDNKIPFFEYAGNSLYCRGTQEVCKPFSTTGKGSYWLMEKFTVAN